jgi:hypothetical protein
MGVGVKEGSFAVPASGGAGAVKIAARFALAGSAGVEIWEALARWPISSSTANARRVDVSFIWVSFQGRFTDELRGSQHTLKKKVSVPPVKEPGTGAGHVAKASRSR